MTERNERPRFPAAGLAAFTVTGLWGCLLIYAAKSFGSAPWYYAERQLFWLAAGCIGFSLCAAIPFRRFMKWRYFLGAASLLLLILVLFFGERVNGMRGWFSFSDYFLFQPSEFAKAAFLLILAGIGGNTRRKESVRFLRMSGVFLCFALPVLLEPDLGSTLVFYAGFLIVLWVSGMRKRYVIPAFLAGPACAAVFLIRHAYARDRILAWLNPDSAVRGTWHIRQFRYAMAEGGLTGSEHGGALWSNAYLPLPHSDSLYAAIAETSGLTGALIVLIAFCAIACAFAKVSMNGTLPFHARIYISATAFLYLTQALIHIGVNVILLPPTGITLPLLSYGGSSLCSTMIAFGLAFGAANPPRRFLSGKPESPCRP